MLKKNLFAFALLMLSVSFTCAQQAESAKQKESTTAAANIVEMKRAEMKKLDRFAGKWAGSGWIQRGRERETFVGTEIVQRKVDGLALLVEGNYKNKDGAIIHETLAVLSPNLKTKNYDFQTFLANGMSGTYEFKTTNGGWQWGFDFPSMAMRYNITIENNVWTEIGEMSQDGGKNWTKIFEMNLKRVE